MTHDPELDELFRRLDAMTPTPEMYEWSGRAIDACAVLEGEIRSAALAFATPAAWHLVHTPDIEQIRQALLKMNNAADYPDQARMAAALKVAQNVIERRNQLAHGQWFPVQGDRFAVISHAKKSEELKGPIVGLDWLQNLQKDAAGTAREIAGSAEVFKAQSINSDTHEPGEAAPGE